MPVPRYASVVFDRCGLALDTTWHLAARGARSDAIYGYPLESRGRRESRVPMTPAVVRTRCTRRTAGAPEHPAFPAQWFLRLMPCSPRSRIPLASVADGLAIDRSPVGPTISISLDTSNGCQDHTVLPSAASLAPYAPTCPHAACRSLDEAFKRRSSARQSAHGISALRTHLAPDAAASTATRPNVRDDGQRPSSRDRMAGVVGLIWVPR
jgi:hypothetical protein